MNLFQQRIADTLQQLQASMIELELWQSQAPSPKALKSTEPFCLDTLSFTQWLQFIFIPNLQSILDSQQALPQLCGIAPLAEEYFKSQPYNAAQVIHTLELIDKLLSGPQS